MHANVTVLASDRVALHLWVHGDAASSVRDQQAVSQRRSSMGMGKDARVARPKASLDAGDLLLKDAVPELDLKVTLPGRGGRDGHGVLASSDEDVGLARDESGAVQRRVALERLDDGEVLLLVPVRTLVRPDGPDLSHPVSQVRFQKEGKEGKGHLCALVLGRGDKVGPVF